MYLVLLVVGLLVTAAGLVTIGFGIPINAFSLGNTLIIAGTTAVAGGLILIGLAVAVRQLRRIADALSRGAMPRPSRPADPGESFVPPTARAAPTPVPARPVMPPRPADLPRAPEPPRSPFNPGEPSGPLDWLRPKASKTSAPAEPPLIEDEAPLSPRGPVRLPLPSMPATSSAPMAEPRLWSPNRTDAPAEAARPSSRSDQIARVAPSSEPKDSEPKESGLFDVVWPNGKSQPGNDEPRETKGDNPMPRRDEPASDKRPEIVPAPSTERPPAILKSGVIDGMAYTLYADGSIEAELPQGTVKFASVDALRTHLEKNS